MSYTVITFRTVIHKNKDIISRKMRLKIPFMSI